MLLNVISMKLLLHVIYSVLKYKTTKYNFLSILDITPYNDLHKSM